MTPQQQGRFCDACQKCVVDFSVMTDKQLIDYVGFHGASCGNFSSSQLNRTMVYEKPYASKIVFYKWAAGVAFFLGLTKPVSSQVNSRPHPIEWVAGNSTIENKNVESVLADEPVGRDATIKYLKFKITKLNGKPYVGALKIKLRLGVEYPGQTYNVTCDKEGYTEFEIIKPFKSNEMGFHFSNSRDASGYFKLNFEEYETNPNASTYIVDRENIGLLLQADIDTKYYKKMRTKQFWRKLKFWKRKRSAGRYIIH